MHRDPITGKFASDNKKIPRGESIGKKRHVHKCGKCKKSWIHPVGTIMTSHFIPFCQEDYFLSCDKCRNTII